MEEWKTTAIMVMLQVVYAWMNILLKLAANDGMDLRVAATYRFIFGSVSMLPLAYFFERKTRAKLTWKVFFFALLAGLFGGSLGQNLFLESLVFTSATFASAMLNLLPGVTFLVAVCLRLEDLGWKTIGGKVKVFGTLIGMGGAMVFTFYKGPNITIWKTNINLLTLTSSNTHHHRTSTQSNNPLLGAVLALLCCVSYSLWLIFQAKAAKYYPSPLSFTAMMIWMATILNFIATACMQRDWRQWKLGWNIRLVAVAYSGVFGTTMLYSLTTIIVGIRGPVLVSAFSPMMVIIVATVGSLVLEEDLHLGSLIGGVLMIGGLYIMLWGKSREMKMIADSKLPVEDQLSKA